MSSSQTSSARPGDDAGAPPLQKGGARAIELLDRGLGALDRVILAVCCVLLFGLFGVVILSVFFRYVMNSSLLWGEELARYLAIWLVFLGLSAAHRRSEHVSLKSLIGRIRPVGAAAGARIAEVLTLIVCGGVTMFGIQATAGNFANHQVSPAMQIGIAWIYLAVPVGFGLMSLQSIVRIVRPVPRDAPDDAPSTGGGGG